MRRVIEMIFIQQLIFFGMKFMEIRGSLFNLING